MEKKINQNNVTKNNNAKKPVANKAPVSVVRKPGNPKFEKGVEEMKKFCEQHEYEIKLKENSRKIFLSKVVKDGTTSDIVLIPMGLDRWILECKVMQPKKDKESGKMLNVQKSFNKFENYSTRATRDVIRLYA